MKTSRVSAPPLALLACVLIFAPNLARADERPQNFPVPEPIRDKLKALFEKHYPKATFKDEGLNGIRFEYELTTFEFPYPGIPGKKRETHKVSGPKKGGIKAGVVMSSGSYKGQRVLASRGKSDEERNKGHFAPNKVDRKEFMEVVSALYSEKRNSHMWVWLCYPPDASEEFLKEFDAIFAEFENDVD